ncbi:hypothetical protein C8R46DRAFT_1281233 [Mycena filopes]|nr:hypothetical protein C8R46DRAFT_1281233 [Mycena filopes]
MSPPRLIFSALTWTGKPATLDVSEGAGGDHVGTYPEAASVKLTMSSRTVTLELQGRGKTHFVEYIPLGSTQRSFVYSRHAFNGVAYSGDCLYGGILGEDMGPRIRVCLPGRHAWPERFERVELGRPLTGPPFAFFDTDWVCHNGIHPEKGLAGLTLSPDLPGQIDPPENDLVYEDGHEEGSTVGLGWHAEWVTALLQRKDLRQPLGEMTRLIFNDKTNATWAVEALKVEEVDPWICEEVADEENSEAMRSRGISDYTVRATILRVFVTRPELERLAGQA